MEFLFEFLFQFVGEILLQAVVEVLVELGFHSLADTTKKPRSPAWSSIGFILWGAMAGGISLLLFPHSLIANKHYRILNLAVTPIAAAFIMTLVGRIRDRKGQDLVNLDRFYYAFIFAFAMTSVRFIWAH